MYNHNVYRTMGRLSRGVRMITSVVSWVCEIIVQSVRNVRHSQGLLVAFGSGAEPQAEDASGDATVQFVVASVNAVVARPTWELPVSNTL